MSRTDGSKFDAIKRGELTIEYTDALGSMERRRVKAKGLTTRGPHAYLNAYCYQRSAPRTFRLDRINCFITSDGEVIDGQALLGPYIEQVRLEHAEANPTMPRRSAPREDGFLAKAIDNVRAAIILFVLIWALFATGSWMSYWIVVGSCFIGLVAIGEWLKAKLAP